MDFQYRGVTYQSTPVQSERMEKKLIGRYRGQDCYRAIYNSKLVNHSHPALTYRGVAYGSKPAATTVEQLNETFKIHIPYQQKPVRSSRHHMMTELDRVHNQFLLKKLEQRISVARQKGDRDLVQLLEREKTQLQ